eukprot:TRINITY_DN22_c0_g1_i1.p1 TRINITY_DN22_c0_g1~~TRINITY_DN22_c0_g1_i1.p1  ORF type:complete len:413 (-),score=4.88 TRINITY_DN22_c0_g1_i1:1243-2481(-)
MAKCTSAGTVQRVYFLMLALLKIEVDMSNNGYYPNWAMVNYTLLPGNYFAQSFEGGDWTVYEYNGNNGDTCTIGNYYGQTDVSVPWGLTLKQIEALQKPSTDMLTELLARFCVLEPGCARTYRGHTARQVIDKFRCAVVEAYENQTAQLAQIYALSATFCVRVSPVNAALTALYRRPLDVWYGVHGGQTITLALNDTYVGVVSTLAALELALWPALTAMTTSVYYSGDVWPVGEVASGNSLQLANAPWHHGSTYEVVPQLHAKTACAATACADAANGCASAAAQCKDSSMCSMQDNPFKDACEVGIAGLCGAVAAVAFAANPIVAFAVGTACAAVDTYKTPCQHVSEYFDISNCKKKAQGCSGANQQCGIRNAQCSACSHSCYNPCCGSYQNGCTPPNAMNACHKPNPCVCR